MNFLEKIRPKEKLRYLRWFDILIITGIMFGTFIIISTQLFIGLLQSDPQAIQESAESMDITSDGAASSGNFTIQAILLLITILYLIIRNFDFKQLKIRLHPSVIIWVPVLFSIMGLFGDFITTISGEYNYFDPSLLQYIDPLEIVNKFLALSPLAIGYAFLNGFYEEFFFLGLMTSVKDKHKWYALAFSTLVRVSFHTYQGLVWALVIGVVYGLFYYFMYKKVIKNLLPFFLMHALADMFGSSLIYLLIAWDY